METTIASSAGPKEAPPTIPAPAEEKQPDWTNADDFAGQLRPCPFCAGEDADFRMEGDEDAYSVEVRCPKCGARGTAVPLDGKPDAWENSRAAFLAFIAWNTRTRIPTATPAPGDNQP